MSITYSEISSLLSEAKKKKPLTTGDCDAPEVDDSIAKISEATYPSDFRNPDGSKRSVAKKKRDRPQQDDQERDRHGRRKTIDEVLGGQPGDGYIGHPRLNIKNPISPPKKQTKVAPKNTGLAGRLGNRATEIERMLGNSYEPEGETIEEKSAAWQRSSGKNKEGGLNEKGRKSYERENPGSDLKAPSKEKGNKRRASFCARMKGMKKKLTSAKTAGDPDSRINKSLRAWNC